MKTKTIIAASAALLLAGCSSSNVEPTTTSNTQGDLGQCNGANSCKGRGSCATTKNNCAGQNSCRGKGWLPLTASDCNQRGGRFASFRKN